MTLEPGTAVWVRAFPFQVELRQDLEQQAAWRAIALSVTTTQKKGPYVVASLLGSRSPTRRAVLTCAISAFKAYDQLGPSAADGDTLASVLGLRGDAAKCATAIDKAANKAPNRGLMLTSDDLARTTLKSKWLRLSTRFLNIAARLPMAVH